MNYSEKERKIDVFCLITFPSIFIILAILAGCGIAFANFSETYVMMTEIISAIVVSILPILRLKKKFIAPYWFIGVITTVPLLHSASLFLGFYESFEYWDIIAHSYSSLVVGLVVFIALLIIARYTKNISMGSTKTILILAFIMAWGFGNIWEIMEWGIDLAFGNAFMSYSVFDTLRDLIVSDLLGAIALEVIAYLVLKYRTINEIVDSMGLESYMLRAGNKWDKLTTPGYEGSYLHSENKNKK